MPRPKGHYGSGKNELTVKNSAPKYPDKKPDCTKLLRALEDALTGILWIDDSQVVRQVVGKSYADTGDAKIGAHVFVIRIE
jgi:crossover junction endodeoxyribonuclease RusA